WYRKWPRSGAGRAEIAVVATRWRPATPKTTPAARAAIGIVIRPVHAPAWPPAFRPLIKEIGAIRIRSWLGTPAGPVGYKHRSVGSTKVWSSHLDVGPHKEKIRDGRQAADN